MSLQRLLRIQGGPNFLQMKLREVTMQMTILSLEFAILLVSTKWNVDSDQ